MPVLPEIAENNRVQRERLKKLVASLDDAGLRRRLANGWTVAMTLGHLAFWDRARLLLLQLWAKGDYVTGAYDSTVFNNAMAPMLALIPPMKLAAFAVEAAEDVDRLLEELPDEVIGDALARPDPPHVNRGEHRGHHLDRIEAVLRG